MNDRTDASRRDFLKGSVAAVGGSLAGGLSVAHTAHAAGSDLIKIGLVGCGGRGTGAASQALSTDGPVQLVAMADAFDDRLEASLSRLKRNESLNIDVPEERRFYGFDAHQKLIDSGVDLVILATPPGFRPIHFKAAVDAGKHLFLEKPLAVDAPGVRSVLDANKKAKQNGLAVGVGLQRHHQNCYLETLKRIQDGQIGEILFMRAYWNAGGVWDPRKTREQCTGEMEYQMRNWYYYNWLCGDHIVEQHIHNLDVINWVKDAYPVRCQGQGGRQVRIDKKYGEIFDHHFVEFEYADGSRMLSQCRHIRPCWNAVSEHVHGTKGTADMSSRATSIEGRSGERWRYRSDNNPYQTEHDELFRSIRAGNPINEGDYGALSTMTAIMGRMATYSGKELTWDEVINSQISLAPERYAWDAEPPVLPDDHGRYRIAVPGQTRVV